MKINGKKITAKYFGYDGCHKIYLLEDEIEREDCQANDYDIHPISDLQKTYNDSCYLRFISPWDLNKPNYVNQAEEAEFEF